MKKLLTFTIGIIAAIAFTVNANAAAIGFYEPSYLDMPAQSESGVIDRTSLIYNSNTGLYIKSWYVEPYERRIILVPHEWCQGLGAYHMELQRYGSPVTGGSFYEGNGGWVIDLYGTNPSNGFDVEVRFAPTNPIYQGIVIFPGEILSYPDLIERMIFRID